MKARGPRDRKKAHGLGILAERAAVLILRLKGYRILACRYCVREGEIDIITRRGDTVAFVEVKVRPTLDEARTATKTWLASNPWAAPLTWRGDAVYFASWRWPRHEIAAFELDLG
jgi:putative endonuclease